MDLLAQLTAIPGVPGREDRIRDFIRKQVEKHFDQMYVDAMGTLIGVRKPRPAGKKASAKPKKVMLAAHMDQIGFLVRYIDDNGFARINPVGGFDTRNLFARRALVCTDSGDLPAVLNPGGKPVHIASQEDRNKVPEIHEFVLDFGMSAAEVKKKVNIGDMVVMVQPLQRIGDTVVAQALDNRVGCWAQIRAIQNLKHHNCEIHACWTVQEEVGLRGAGTAAFDVDPDLALSCDTTLCCDTPGIETDQQINKMGCGVALKVMDSSMITDISVLKEIEAVAKKNKIPYQRSILPRGGQDGGAIQRTRRGVRVGVFACPIRYIHTVSEMASVKDIESYRDLLTAYLASL